MSTNNQRANSNSQTRSCFKPKCMQSAQFQSEPSLLCYGPYPQIFRPQSWASCKCVAGGIVQWAWLKGRATWAGQEMAEDDGRGECPKRSEENPRVSKGLASSTSLSSTVNMTGSGRLGIVQGRKRKLPMRGFNKDEEKAKGRDGLHSRHEKSLSSGLLCVA